MSASPAAVHVEPQSWEDYPQTKQLRERIAVLERELRESTAPPDAERMRALETAANQMLEWLDEMAQGEGDVPSGVLRRFCEGLAERLRETVFG